MSKKSSRIDMLVLLNNTLRDIAADSENQTAEILRGNMAAMINHVDGILALDGIGSVSANNKR